MELKTEKYVKELKTKTDVATVWVKVCGVSSEEESLPWE